MPVTNRSAPASAHGPIVSALTPPSTERSSSGRPHRPEPAKLLQRHRLELLASEPRHDAHHQHQVAVVKIRLDGLQRRGRVEGQARGDSLSPDLLQERPGILHGLDVNRQQIGPARQNDRRIARLGDHQVDVQRQAGQPPHRFEHRKAEADVGHEMPVHDVQVQDPRPAASARRISSGEIAEVAGQQRGRDHRHGARVGLRWSLRPTTDPSFQNPWFHRKTLPTVQCRAPAAAGRHCGCRDAARLFVADSILPTRPRAVCAVFILDCISLLDKDLLRNLPCRGLREESCSFGQVASPLA